MKFLLCGCFHGSVPSKFLQIIKKEKPDYILSTGDFNNANELRKIIFKNFNSKKSLQEIVGKKRFEILFKEYIKSGIKTLKKLNSLNLPIITCYGNNDESARSPQHRREKRGVKENVEFLIKGLKNIELMDYRYKKFGDYFIYFIGAKFPRKKKATFRIALQEYKNLDKFFKKVNPKKVILVTHEPPKNTKFDRVVNKNSPANGKHIGDYVIKKIILKYKPFLHIFGHMHEHQGKQYLGKTLLISHGPAQYGKFALLELERDKIKKLKFYT